MENLDSYFAPAHREGTETLMRQYGAISESTHLVRTLNALPQLILILNSSRQIVFANQAVLKLLKIKDLVQIIGRRPGEAFGCIYADQAPNGCGTGRQCRVCGAARAILCGIQDKEATEECNILQSGGEALDLRVHSESLTVGDKALVLFSAENISDERLRRELERTFFHDLLNTVSGISGALKMMQEVEDPDEARELADLFTDAAGQMTQSIQAQKEMIAAYRGDLPVNPTSIHTLDLIQSLVKRYECHPLAQGKSVVVDEAVELIPLCTDKALLGRVLENLLKNALEAVPERNEIRIGCRRAEGQVVFWVYNSTAMSEDTQLKLFKRSFTTKGEGRGTGLFGVKLITEKYLKGTVSFHSSLDKGTTFFVSIPQSL